MSTDPVGDAERRRGEAAAIDRTAHPATRASLGRDLAALGVVPGGTVLVHSSLSRLGWVVGGAQAVVEALLDAVGPSGTIVVPTHSTSLSEPSRWQRPAVPGEWWDTIRHEMPPFDPRLTPTQDMGSTVECFRHLPGARRSAHPRVSFTAVGPEAEAIVGRHDLEVCFGEGSPLARLYEAEASVLLLGVGHANNTSLHLAEHRATFDGKEIFEQGSPVMEAGARRWVTYSQLDDDATDFPALGEELARAGLQRTGTVGAGTGLLMDQRAVVDFAVRWFEQHRPRRAGPT